MTLDELEIKRQKLRCFYTKKEMDEILLNTSLSVIVENLPNVGVEGYLYLIPTEEEDTYTQYVWIDGLWESLGDRKDKLVNFVTELELHSAIEDYCPIIEDARNSNSAAITGIAPFSTLENGLKILLHLTYHTPNNSTLNLTLANGTTTGAKSIVYQTDNGTALLVPISDTYGQYKARQYILMVYESASSRWICTSPVLKNTTYNTTTVAEVETGTNNTGKLISPSTLNTLLQQKVNTITEVTWSELKTLRDSSELSPGSLYRITDYQCTTTQQNTRSAGHQFDIVLLALSENKLAEEGWAMMNESNVYDVTFSGDNITKKCWLYPNEDGEYNIVDCSTLLGQSGIVDDDMTIDETAKTIIVEAYGSGLTIPDLTYNYFQNSNLSAWKVWYCLDNDTTRFAWADNSRDKFIKINGASEYFVRDSSKDRTSGSDRIYWQSTVNENAYCLTNTENNPTYAVLYSNGRYIDDYSVIEQKLGNENGCGVIYRLIDEFNNDIKYDFKNIQFKRTITDGQYDANGTETWCYTLNLWYNDMCQDASIVGNTLQNDEGYVNGVYDNILGYATAYDLYIEGVDTFAFALGDNVILSVPEGDYYGIHSNIIRNYFKGNTIGTEFHSNIIGNGFVDNLIGNSFNSNTIGNTFIGNTIGSNFIGNTIGNDFNSMTISDNTNNKNYGNYGVELATKDDLN